MEIILNGKEKTLEEPCTLADLIHQLDQEPQQVAVQVNRQIIKRDQYDNYQIQDGDRVEMLHFVGGGGL